MDTPDAELTGLLACLKRAYRTAGLRYSDVAQRIGVSEMTVKRHMAGRGLSVQTLQRLCAAAEMTLTELAAMAGAGQGDVPVATEAQTRAVAMDIALSMTFYLLTRGWPPRRIARELQLDDPTITGLLLKLDKLDVIELHPGDRVRVLRRLSPDIRHEATAFALIARRVHQFFDRADLHDPTMAWTSGVARLSPAAVAKAARLLDELRDTVFALGEDDLDLPTDETSWYMMFAALRPVGIDELLHESASDG